MFEGCSKVTSIDFSNFNTSNVKHMAYMFKNCHLLSSLNLSNFNTSNVVNSMNYMFIGCSSLTSLDLSNFDTSKVNDMSNMFEGCSKLEYINLYNCEENTLTNIFNQLKKNVITCINNEIISNNDILAQINSKTCFIDCSDDWEIKKEMIDYADDCQCNLDNCLSCPSFNDTNKRLCTQCNNDFYPIENEPLNIGGYINCYKEPIKGYYLDNISSIFKKCFYTCETCEIGGDNITHNCLNCSEEYKYELNIGDYKNCFNEEGIIDSTIVKTETMSIIIKHKETTILGNIHSTNRIIEKQSNIQSFIEEEKQSNTQSIFEEDKAHIKNCTKNKLYEFNHKCYEKCPNNTIESETKSFSCKLSCPSNLPYEEILTQKCIKDCSTTDMFKKKCITNYKEEKEEKKEDLGKKIFKNKK